MQLYNHKRLSVRGEDNFPLSRKSRRKIGTFLQSMQIEFIEFGGNLKKIGWKVPKFDIKRWKKGFFRYFLDKIGMQIGKFDKK